VKTSSIVFVDASAWIALFHQKDAHHLSAWHVYERLLDEGGWFLSTNWVAYETISVLKSRASYNAAKTLWNILQDADLSQLVPIDKQLEDRAVDLFWRYRDKRWGIVDCSSMLVMEITNCSLSFGYDHHFVEASKQFGFTLLDS